VGKLASMEAFIRVAECGSFSGAAEELGVSATMVAKQIRAIEDRLGARLLHRTTRRHQLTEVGLLYLERCRAALASVELAESSALELQQSPRGRLRLVTPVGYGARTLVPALADWLALHPHVGIDLTLNDRPEEQVLKGLELGVVIGDVQESGLVARPLQSYRRVLAAAPSYLSAHGEPRHPNDLTLHSCLGLGYWRHHDRWHLLGPDNETCVVQVSGRFSANQGSALLSAALQGVGIVLQPQDALVEKIAAGRLKPVLPMWSFKPTTVNLVYARDRRPTAKLRSAIDFLVARFGEPAP
jgi:DNA-binding transcriptional LysR family regulator